MSVLMVGSIVMHGALTSRLAPLGGRSEAHDGMITRISCAWRLRAGGPTTVRKCEVQHLSIALQSMIH